MKVNVKNLSAFATSPTPVDRDGWLNKRGDVNKSFQRRWFVLKGNLLFYFEKKGDKEPVGAIFLEGCTIELAEDEYFSFKIMFHGRGSREYVLSADSQDSMEQWMKALACAGYDYMKLMVVELQRQLDAMEEAMTFVGEEVKEETGPKIPPRGQRYNPFNKSSDLNATTATSSSNSKDSVKNQEHVPRDRISFRQLHNAYGRKILGDRSDWRQKQLQNQNKSEIAPSPASKDDHRHKPQKQDEAPLIVL